MDWNPTTQDNLVVFPDMSRIAIDILEAEDLAHVESMAPQCYGRIAASMRHHSEGQSHFRTLRNANLPDLRAMNCFVQLYFEYFQPIFPMLHQATFDTSRQPWQLRIGSSRYGVSIFKTSRIFPVCQCNAGTSAQMHR